MNSLSLEDQQWFSGTARMHSEQSMKKTGEGSGICQALTLGYCGITQSRQCKSGDFPQAALPENQWENGKMVV